MKRNLTTEFRLMITEGVVALELWMERNLIDGRLIRYSDLERLDRERAFNVEHANNLIECGDIGFIDPILRNISIGDEKAAVDRLLASFE